MGEDIVAVAVWYEIRFEGLTVLVDIPQGRLDPTLLGLVNNEILKEIDVALVPPVLLAVN